MKLLTILGIILYTISPVITASKWTIIAETLQKSVVFIEAYDGEEKTGSCTGFIIDSEKRHVLTAAHCNAPKILADGTTTYKIFLDERKDLMVLRASNIDGPAIKLAATPPDRGDEVASMGYGFGLDDPMFRIANISNVRMDIESLSGPFNMIDSEFIGGQSGGPVVNDRGEVVMIVQRGNVGFGIGIGADLIRDRVGKYFGK